MQSKGEKGNRFPQEMNRRLTAIEQKNGKKRKRGKAFTKKRRLFSPSHGPFVTNNQHKLTDGTRLPPPHGIYTDIRFFFSGGGKRSECPKKSRRRRGSSDLSVRLNKHVRPSARCSAAKVNERVFPLSRLVLRTNGGGRGYSVLVDCQKNLSFSIFRSPTYIDV